MENKTLNTDKNKALNIAVVMRCYYDDELCGGKINKVGGFKKYLCDNCLKFENSVKMKY